MARSRNLAKGKVAQVEGLDELVKKFEALKDAVSSDDAKKVLMRAALTMRDKAREMAPEDTGRLKNAIRAAYGKEHESKNDALDVIVTVKYRGDDGAPHAHLVEFGTSKMPAHPYMRPAFTATKGEMTKIIAEGLRNLIHEAAQK